MQTGHTKGQGLARSGPGSANHIPTLNDGYKGFGLDGSETGYTPGTQYVNDGRTHPRFDPARIVGGQNRRIFPIDRTVLFGLYIYIFGTAIREGSNNNNNKGVSE